ncbi:helicase-related protein [Clostridium perfringens]
MDNLQENLLIKILEHYENEVYQYEEHFVKTVYKDITTDTWYEEKDYYDEDDELTATDIIKKAITCSSLKELCESIYNKEYKYSWNGGYDSYTSFFDSMYYDNIAYDIGFDSLGDFIINNYAQEFKRLFKEELDIDNNYDNYELDGWECSEIVESLSYNNESISKYCDLINNIDCIIDEWLTNENVNIDALLTGFIAANKSFNIEDLINDIINIKPSLNLKDRIESISNVFVENICSNFVSHKVSEILNDSTNSDYNKNISELKNIDSIKNFFKKYNCKSQFIDFVLSEEKSKNFVVGNILKDYSLDELKSNFTKIEDVEIIALIEARMGKEQLLNILKFNDSEIKDVLSKTIFAQLEKSSKAIVDSSCYKFYDFYLNACKQNNMEPEFIINKFQFNDEFLENNLIQIFKALSGVHRGSKLELIENPTYIQNLKDKANNYILNTLYDIPKEIEQELNNIINIIRPLSEVIPVESSENGHVCELGDLLNKIITIASKYQAYMLYIELDSHAYDINYLDIINYENCLLDIQRYGFKKMLNTSYVTENIKSQLKETLSENPKDDFPLARNIKRHFIINVGGTNTGKTYSAIEKLKASSNGVYLAPLRLLALEIQEKLNACDIPCSLFTGEEEDIRLNACHMSMTIEKCDFSKRYDVCVIDECQMIGDTQRGYAWTNAILGVYCKEVHLCTAPEGLDIILKLINECGDSYEIINHTRLTPLVIEESQYQLPNKYNHGSLQEGDALIVFSKKQVLAISSQLKSKGINASVIYGALPYKSRKKQFELFLNKTNSVVVCTDAIGMGVNLPIKRVVFLEDKKFDGKTFRGINSAEVKQIAGRAGRRGLYDKGFVNALSGKKNIRKLLNQNTPNINYAYLLPPKTIIDISGPLDETIKMWNKINLPSLYKKGDTSRLLDMLNRLQSYKSKLSKEELYNAITLPFDEKQNELMTQFKSYLNCYVKKDVYLSKPSCPISPTLDDLELYYKKLDLYYAFSKKFCMRIDSDWLSEEKDKTSNNINNLIINNIDKLKKKCPQCGKKLDFTWQHKLCDNCFRANRSYYYYDDYDYNY